MFPVFLLVVIGVSALFLALILGWSVRHGISPTILLRDPAQSQHIWPFTGLVSHLGILTIWSSVAICVFGAIVVGDRDTAFFLLSFGILSAVIALDDLFMLHEYFWPRRGVPTKVSQIALGLFGSVLLVIYRRRLIGPEHLAFYLAILLLGISLAVDLMVPYSVTSTVIEDTAKFTGYVLWTVHWAALLRRALARRAQAPEI